MERSIRVEVKAILTTRQIMKTGSVWISLPEGASVEKLLNVLVDKWGEDLRYHLFEPATSFSGLRPHIHILVNGRHFAFTGGMSTVLENGDSVLIMPPAGGG
ncbi:MAG: MoaD/ThiS family protein [Desulfobacteraceae bacterium]|nr:MoaD/ThiS family protein [Desulfobacteraceae bacterium]